MGKQSSSSSPAHSFPLQSHGSLWNLVRKKCGSIDSSQGVLWQPNHSSDFGSLFHLISKNSNTKSQPELPVPSYGSRFDPELKIWKCVSVVDWFQETHNSLLINHPESCPQVWGGKAGAARRGSSIQSISNLDLSVPREWGRLDQSLCGRLESHEMVGSVCNSAAEITQCCNTLPFYSLLGDHSWADPTFCICCYSRATPSTSKSLPGNVLLVTLTANPRNTRG